MAYAAVQKHPRYPVSVPVIPACQGGVETLSLQNISLGGAYVCSAQPHPSGSWVGVRLDTRGSAVDAFARVVHVVDRSRGVQLPSGMGLHFEDMSQESRLALLRFVESAAGGDTDVRALRTAPRFVGRTAVSVRVGDRGGLREMWLNNVSRGGLYVEAESPPPAGTVVTVNLATPGGALNLHAEVVHIVTRELAAQVGQRPGAGLQFVMPDARTLQALQRYLDGRAEKLGAAEMAPAGVGAHDLMVEAKRFFECVDRQDHFGALGLSSAASGDDVSRRVCELRGLFMKMPDDASFAQLARLQAALRALPRVEQDVQRILQNQTNQIVPLATPPTSVARAPGESLEQRMMRQVKESADLELIGDLPAAENLLQEVLRVDADHAPAKVALRRVRLRADREAQQRHNAMAADLLTQAEVFASNAGMGEQAALNVAKAIGMTHSRALRSRGLVVLARLGASQPAVKLAKQLIEQDATDPAPWTVLLRIYEQCGHWALAARVAETLSRLCPERPELARRSRELQARSRRAV